MNNEIFTFELSLDEINLILEALGNMPFNKVFVVIHNLKAQYQKQNNEKEETGLSPPINQNQ